MLQEISFFLVVAGGSFALHVFARKRRTVISRFLDEANLQIQKLEQLSARVESGSGLFGSCRAEFFRSRRPQLVQIAETIVYTKTRIKTFYDLGSKTTVSFTGLPTFLATGIEIDKEDLTHLLQSKSRYVTETRQQNLVDEELEKIVPISKVRQMHGR